MSTRGGNNQKGEDKFEIFLKNLRIQKFAVFDYGNSNNKAGNTVRLVYILIIQQVPKKMLKGYLISMHYVKSLEADAGRDRTVDNKILLWKNRICLETK